MVSNVSSETTVIVVDDEPDFLLITKKYLEDSSDLHIESALSVDEAHRLLAEKSFDVIVSDHPMPNKNGIDFLTELRDKGDLTPFILFTGKGREEIVIQALNLGADRYIRKGTDVEAMYTEMTVAIYQLHATSKAKIDLQESEEKYRVLVENTPNMISITQNGVHKFVDKAMCEKTK